MANPPRTLKVEVHDGQRWLSIWTGPGGSQVTVHGVAPDGDQFYLTPSFAPFSLTTLLKVPQYKAQADRLLTDDYKNILRDAKENITVDGGLEVNTGWIVLVPETYELAVDIIKQFHHLLQATYDDGKLHRFILMYMVCSWHRALHATILSWAMESGHVIISQIDDALPPGQDAPPPATNPESPIWYLCASYIAQTFPFKPPEYIENWSQNRLKTLSVMAGMRDAPVTVNKIGSSAIKVWASNFSWDLSFLRVLIDFHIRCLQSTSTNLKSFSGSFQLIARGSDKYTKHF